jgi:hypothetical protein
VDDHHESNSLILGRSGGFPFMGFPHFSWMVYNGKSI